MIACEIFETDLDRIVLRSENWQMSFNLDECKVTHSGYSAKSRTLNTEIEAGKKHAWKAFADYS